MNNSARWKELLKWIRLVDEKMGIVEYLTVQDIIDKIKELKKKKGGKR